MKKVGIIGAGSWGMALAIYLANKGISVNIWSYNLDEIEKVEGNRKCKYLPKANIPETINISNDFKQTVEGTDFILHVTPSKVTREVVKQYKEYVKTQPIFICSKGFEASSLKTLAEVISEELPNIDVGVLSGPSHAEEVCLNIPTALVVACENEEVSDMVQKTIMSETLRVYTSTDIKGVELGGALKNIIAFCAGICSGLKLGDNTFAALITRGLVEVARLGIELGGRHDTFYGLTGLGDLIVTCMSEHSRNRRAGVLIGQGNSLEKTKETVGMVIESIDNIEVAYKLTKIYNVDAPIIDAVYNVLYNNLDPKKAVQLLMTRNAKSE